MLTDLDRALLDFEAQWPGHTSAKEEAIRTRLDLAPARYYQLLGRLIDREDALAHDPLLIGRLRRGRDDRRRDRARRMSAAS
ncbi:DUF3263 domain-containing protein [Microbacterium sp. GXF7504]